MPDRLHLLEDEAEWTATVAGERVALADGHGTFVVTADEAGRLTAAGETDPAVTGVAAASGGDTVWVSIAGHLFEYRVSHVARRARGHGRDQDAFMPPMPATVVRILVAPGEAVRNGDLLVALEAMKMELPIRAPRDGVVAAVHCREGELVQPGTVLLDLT